MRSGICQFDYSKLCGREIDINKPCPLCLNYNDGKCVLNKLGKTEKRKTIRKMEEKYE